MAFNVTTLGDYFNLGWNVKPKVPKSGYTPAVGHLVIQDTSIANGVDLIAADENPYGIVISVDSWSAAAPTSPISVAELLPGTEIMLPTTGTVNKGDKIEGNGTALAQMGTGQSRTPVRADNANGVGQVIGSGAGESPAGANTCVVRF